MRIRVCVFIFFQCIALAAYLCLIIIMFGNKEDKMYKASIRARNGSR